MSSDPSKSSSAWVPLYEALWQTGQRIALAMLRGSAHERDREDIVATAITQTVMGFLEKNPNACNAPPPPGDLEDMMKTIVRRRLLDHHRRNYCRTLVPFDDSVAAGLPDFSSSPADHAEVEDLWQTVAALDPPLPDLFTDRFLLGWSTTEIAARRSMNPNTVLSHFHRGFARLRETLLEFQP